MRNIALVAEMGRGKSTEAFNIVESFLHKDLYVNDIQGQYKKYPNNKIKGRCTTDQFIQIVQNVKNSVIVFEEATAFFSNKGREEAVIELLISNYHSKNVIIFVFHSLRTVPVEIMDHIQFLILWHTNDRVTLIKNKFKDDEHLLKIFSDVEEKTRGTDKNRDTGEFADERSKEFYHYKRIYSR